MKYESTTVGDRLWPSLQWTNKARRLVIVVAVVAVAGSKTPVSWTEHPTASSRAARTDLDWDVLDLDLLDSRWCQSTIWSGRRRSAMAWHEM